jgi:hypothetical protein
MREDDDDLEGRKSKRLKKNKDTSNKGGISKPVISWFSVFNRSGEDLVFGSVKLEQFLST